MNHLATIRMNIQKKGLSLQTQNWDKKLTLDTLRRVLDGEAVNPQHLRELV